jgi:hypothetical protein
MTRLADVVLHKYGGNTLFEPRNKVALNWLRKSLDVDPWRWRGDCVILHTSQVEEVVAILREDGAIVKEEGG